MEFPISLKMEVNWGDMDAYGHVNNTIFFKYFESVRMKYLEHVKALDLMESQSIGPILAATSCQFKAPLIYPAEIEVFASVKSIGNTSMVMEYKIILGNNDLAALGDSVIVMHHYDSGSNVAVPDELVRRIEELEGKALR
ncbi:MAG: acyl-CoA thioesterase [Bacteroidota bacterium]